MHYEELVSDPRRTLATLSEFLDHELDYDRIQAARLGRLSESNSSFREDVAEEHRSPVKRWQERLSASEVAAVETAIGESLNEFGYEPTIPEPARHRGLRERATRRFYRTLFDAKLWLKTRTPVGRLANLSVLEMEKPARHPPNSETRDAASSP